jgi:DNA ligase (NAD+)
MYNEQFIDLLGNFEAIMTKNSEPFRAKAYKKAQETIMTYNKPITNIEQLKGLPNIGTTVLEKLLEFVNTGKNELIEQEKNNPVNLFLNVYGIGPKKADELVKVHGITSIEELRKRKEEVLNDVQQVGLKYYEDILLRIPRAEIEEYNKVFTSVLRLVLKTLSLHAETDDKTTFEIVGSYRRQARESGDIDVIITSPSNNVFTLFIDVLIKHNIIKEVLSRGNIKCLVIGLCPGCKHARRIDFLFCNKEEFPFSILYFTGSKTFNTMMRQKALQMGYTLNEHGICRMENKVKSTEKVDHVFTSEKSIFDFLKMEYKEPWERTGLTVITDGSTTKSINEPIKEQIIPKPKNTTQKRKQKKKINDNNDNDNNDNNNADNVDNTVIKVVSEFKKDGISILNKYNEKQLKELILFANEKYHNHNPIMTDNEYDIIIDFVNSKYTPISIIGAQVDKNKAVLPYEMPSLNKIKPDTNALSQWLSKYSGPYVLSGKLDGVSGLYTTEGDIPALYTRGDGRVGQDISHLIPYLDLPKIKGIVIRGEFIILKKVFENKYKGEFACARNMVAGLINHKHTDTYYYEKIKDVQFISYEIIKPTMKPTDQFKYFIANKINNTPCVSISILTNEILSEWLLSIRHQHLYETDGVVVANDGLYARKFENPEHAFAFKMVLSEQCSEAKVVDVLWTPSKDGYLKPRVQIEPIVIGGVKIEFATGFNASFIKQNKIGVGALIQLIRSGDVIPHIKEVIVPAVEGKMPSCEYKWNETGVDILLDDINGNDIVLEKNMTLFFKGIEVDGLSSGSINKLIKAGYNSVPKIINMTKEEIIKIDGFGDKSAEKICEGIKDKIKNVSLVKLMAASNIFGRGFGERKLEPIIEAYPNILGSHETKEEKLKKVLQVKGIAQKSAELFVSNIDEFNAFFKDCKGEPSTQMVVTDSSNNTNIDVGHSLYKKSIILTGFRDKNFMNTLKTVGATIGTSVSKNTFAVVYKDSSDDNKGSDKLENAKKLNIPIFTLIDFMKLYFKP